MDAAADKRPPNAGFRWNWVSIFLALGGGVKGDKDLTSPFSSLIDGK